MESSSMLKEVGLALLGLLPPGGGVFLPAPLVAWKTPSPRDTTGFLLPWESPLGRPKPCLASSARVEVSTSSSCECRPSSAGWLPASSSSFCLSRDGDGTLCLASRSGSCPSSRSREFWLARRAASASVTSFRPLISAVGFSIGLTAWPLTLLPHSCFAAAMPFPSFGAATRSAEATEFCLLLLLRLCRSALVSSIEGVVSYGS
mmetsp:Transcript_29807/g.83995  ORF Transcript_29807/g.83995 Transcript_29807/m.83995 type:complete len:204 (+) Transcript_29807:468-1079(+)